eukprot:TRINITY_DN6749_c0_g2_i2.p2 TRINITY_DN6749_c0_g2~~TRINITY_DN6749_c0_g2_i2.p2  ORF type:complete len:112 (-),score=23.02 TRINITY_DN6749_c0_g2_i2:13-348(-)
MRASIATKKTMKNGMKNWPQALIWCSSSSVNAIAICGAAPMMAATAPVAPRRLTSWLLAADGPETKAEPAKSTAATRATIGSMMEADRTAAMVAVRGEWMYTLRRSEHEAF